MKDKQHLFRRVVHSMAWIFLLYYLLPQKIAGYSRSFILLALVLIILGFESLRLYMGWRIFGMREYETGNIAAYAWATMAAGIALLLFPMYIAVVCLVGMGAVDPLIGEIQMRYDRLYPYVPFVVWTAIAVALIHSITEFHVGAVTAMAVVGAVSAVAVENPSFIIDDDFLMVVVPCVVLKVMEVSMI